MIARHRRRRPPRRPARRTHRRHHRHAARRRRASPCRPRSSTARSYVPTGVGLLLFGLGAGIAMPAATELIMATLPPARAGVGSAVNDTVRELGGALGVAVIGSVAASSYTSNLRRPASTTSPRTSRAVVSDNIGAALAVSGHLGADGAQLADAAREAFVTSMTGSLWVGVALAALATVIAWTRLPKPHPPTDTPPTAMPITPHRPSPPARSPCPRSRARHDHHHNPRPGRAHAGDQRSHRRPGTQRSTRPHRPDRHPHHPRWCARGRRSRHRTVRRRRGARHHRIGARSVRIVVGAARRPHRPLDGSAAALGRRAGNRDGPRRRDHPRRRPDRQRGRMGVAAGDPCARRLDDRPVSTRTCAAGPAPSSSTRCSRRWRCPPWVAPTRPTARRPTHPASAMPGRLVDVGGHQLHINCTGSGSPTVVLEPGMGEPSTVMAAWIAPDVATTTRVCVYDRAGRGWSESAAAPQDGGAGRHRPPHPAVTCRRARPVRARRSLGRGDLRPQLRPLFPQDVAGVVLLDSMHPEQYTRMAVLARLLRDVPTHVGRDAVALTARDRPADLRRPSTASCPPPNATRSAPSSRRHGTTAASETSSARSAPPWARPPSCTAWATSRSPSSPRAAARSRLVPRCRTTSRPCRPTACTGCSTNANHAMVVEDEDTARESSQAILDVVNAVRTYTPMNAEDG